MLVVIKNRYNAGLLKQHLLEPISASIAQGATIPKKRRDATDGSSWSLVGDGMRFGCKIEVEGVERDEDPNRHAKACLSCGASSCD